MTDKDLGSAPPAERVTPPVNYELYDEHMLHIPREGKYETAGERLLDRELEKEIVAGVPHFKPGQHEAVYHGEHSDFFTGAPMDIARLTYVDAMGHACVVVCAREPRRPWKATWIGRAGFVTAERAIRAPDDFQLSNKMLLALTRAEGALRPERTQMNPHA